MFHFVGYSNGTGAIDVYGTAYIIIKLHGI